MSAMPIALLLTTAATGAVGVAVLRTVLKLRRQVAELHTQLAQNQAAAMRALLPAARSHADAEQIRAAVAEALAEEAFADSRLDGWGIDVEVLQH
ncbi:hypothetical protein AB0D38_43560, partial [Streptomyces sp. NPDC048279]